MKIKKFSSRTVPEALAAVRAEFGEDAVILSTKRSEVDPRRFEVVAAMDVPDREAKPPTFPRVTSDEIPALTPRRAVGGGRSARPPAPARVSVSSDEPMLPRPLGTGAGTREEPAIVSLDEAIVADAAPRVGGTPPRAPESSADAISSIEEELERGAAERSADDAEPRDRTRLLDEIQGLRGRLETVAGLLLSSSPDDLPEEGRRMHLRLLETGLDARVATAVLRRAEKIDVPLERAVHHILSAAVRCEGAIGRGLGQQVIALFGPTGVGKTTTIAKIAAQLILQEKRRVSLVSADAFRVGGTQQLEFYADVLETPFHAAHDRESLARALSQSGDAEVVLVDTTGRGSADASGVDEIGKLLDGEHRMQRWLALSAVASTTDNLAALRTFSKLRPAGVVVTKIDETSAHGAVGTVVIRSGLPLRYLTDGQNVPDDLVVATRDTFPELLLEGRSS